MEPIPLPSYDFSTFFGSDELSDLTLVLTAELGAEEPEQLQRPAKRARGNDSAAVAQPHAEGCKEELPGHAMVLAGSSPVFKAQLARWQQQPTEERSSRPIITLHVDSPDQLEAARALVQFMYQRQLPGDAPQRLLVTILQLSDMFDVQMCIVACINALGKLQLEWDTVLHVLALPPSMDSSQLLSSLTTKANEQLQQQLGDLEVAWASDEGRERFLALPLKGVQLLLGDERTKVAFENTALVALTVWVQQHSDLSVRDKQRLAQHIRLPYLTAFAGFILPPALPWLSEALGPSVNAAATGAAILLSTGFPYEGKVFTYASKLGWPESWELGRRPLSRRAQACLTWKVSLEELQPTYDTGTHLVSPATGLGGMQWHMMLFRRQNPSSLRTAIIHRADPSLINALAAAGAVRLPLALHKASITAVMPGRPDADKRNIYTAQSPSTCGTSASDLWGLGDMPDWEPQRFDPWLDAQGQLTLHMEVEDFY